MKRALALALTAAAALPASAAAQEEPPPPVPDEVRAVVVFTPIAFGEPTYVNGVLRGVDQARQTVALEESPFPFGTWSEVATTATDGGGYFTFKRRPSLVTRWRAVSRTANSGTSAEVQGDVAARLRFALRLSGRSAAAYNGTLGPAHASGLVIQRLARNRSWTTVATPRLSATRFSGRLRVRGKTTLRAAFATDGDHLAAVSRPVTIEPPRRR